MRRSALAVTLLAVGMLLGATTAGPAAWAQSNATDQGSEGGQAFEVRCTELRCTFDARSATLPNGSIESYGWDFDDGDTADGRVVNHTFSTPGSYNVTLTLTDQDGREHNRTRTVTVEAIGRAGEDSVPWSGLVLGVLALAGSIAVARVT